MQSYQIVLVRPDLLSAVFFPLLSLFFFAWLVLPFFRNRNRGIYIVRGNTRGFARSGNRYGYGVVFADGNLSKGFLVEKYGTGDIGYISSLMTKIMLGIFFLCAILPLILIFVRLNAV